jgi:hypothetical protein
MLELAPWFCFTPLMFVVTMPVLGWSVSTR